MRLLHAGFMKFRMALLAAHIPIHPYRASCFLQPSSAKFPYVYACETAVSRDLEVIRMRSRIGFELEDTNALRIVNKGNTRVPPSVTDLALIVSCVAQPTMVMMDHASENHERETSTTGFIRPFIRSNRTLYKLRPHGSSQSKCA